MGNMEKLPIFPPWAGWPGDRPAVVAEVGFNHGGNEDLAWEMIVSAHEAGADFVKLQTFKVADFIHPSLDCYQNVQTMELCNGANERLFVKAAKKGIHLFSTPFDKASADLLESFNVPAYKIASMDNDHFALLFHVARKEKPVLVSLGMAGIEVAKSVIQTVRKAGNSKILLLHCISDYPAKLEDMHLAAIAGIRNDLNVFSGLSDHSEGIRAALAAAALGAAVIEKHFTTDRKLAQTIPDADNDISIEPSELKELVKFCKSLPIMIGTWPRPLTRGEQIGVTDFKRGVYAARDIAAGEIVDSDAVCFLRPVKGIPAGQWPRYAGCCAKQSIKAMEPIRSEDLSI
ncbi:NeuB family protein [Candidatus Parcubacteria bacterium]|nr:MAG: NeuB family protein [Candidatus Parcubacteria bacterium]